MGPVPLVSQAQALLSLPWLHLSSLIVANIDICLSSVLQPAFCVSISCAQDTENSDGGSAEAHSVWQRQYPGSIRSLNLDSNPDLPFKSRSFPPPQHSVCCGYLQCLAWSPAENEPLVDLDFSPPSHPHPPISILLTSSCQLYPPVALCICLFLPTSIFACLSQSTVTYQYYNSLLFCWSS